MAIQAPQMEFSMPRIRTIKPEFFTHADLFDAEKDTGLPLRIAYAGLWCCADREGRFRWKPRELKLHILPYDDVDMARVLDALTTRGFLVHYAWNGTEYGCIPTFSIHQVINNREKSSEMPSPDDPGVEHISTRAQRVNDACPTPLVQDQGEGKGREGKGREGEARDVEKLSDAKARGQKVIYIGMKCAEIIGWQKGDPTKTFNPIHQWLADGATEDVILATVKRVMEKRTGSVPNSLAYFTSAIGEAVEADKQRRSAEDRAVIDRNIQWNTRMRGYKTAGIWLGDWGPKPEERGCYVPPDVLRQWGM